MIYLMEGLEEFKEQEYSCLKVRIPVERQEKLARYVHEIDRKIGALAYLLFLYGWYQEYKGMDPGKISYGPNGKPFLLEHQDIHFNWSHCKKGVICVLSKEKVGVDIQDYIEYKEDLVRWICSEKECEILWEDKERERLLTRYWTLKESYVKYTGTGIHNKMKALDFSSVSWENQVERGGLQYFLDYRQHSAIAVCSKEQFREIQLVTVENLMDLL